MSDRFGSNFIPIEDVIDSQKLGNYSYNAVKFTILTDDKLLTYEDIMRQLLSSKLLSSNPISSYEVVFIDWEPKDDQKLQGVCQNSSMKALKIHINK